MKRIFLVFFVLCLHALGFASSAAIDDNLKPILASKNVGAFALSLIHLPSGRQENIFISGDKNNPHAFVVQKDSLFQIGSITKTFTAQIALAAIVEKKLSYKDTVSKFFPEYKKYGAITIRQLLNQNSGIADYITAPGFFDTLSNDSHFQGPQLLDIAYKLKNDFKPGTSWAYSNTNYVLLGMILQCIMSLLVFALLNYPLLIALNMCHLSSDSVLSPLISRYLRAQ